MNKPKLLDVTLCAIETRDHELMRLTVQDCVSKVQFGDVLILTDQPLKFDGCIARFHKVPDWPDKLGWCRAKWFDVPMQVRTQFILFVQWDAGVWKPEMWRDEYLEYDYIGAPWWYVNRNVGNSGFSLTSTRLARYVYYHRDVFQCNTPAEDDQLCRKYRAQLEERGFMWAPDSVAYDFAYEGAGPNPKPPTDHFGFHATHNFKHVYTREELKHRARLMIASPHLRESYMMKGLVASCPDIIKEIADEGDEEPKLLAAE